VKVGNGWNRLGIVSCPVALVLTVLHVRDLLQMVSNSPNRPVVTLQCT
jgi:hypothetical protein